MMFTTLTFVLFLPVVFALYWGVRHRTSQNGLLIIASYAFYGWWDVRFCALMLASSLVDYAVGLMLSSTQSVRRRRILLSISLAANLGMLGFFKYANFFADSLQSMAATVGYSFDAITLEIVLPVGISFYTFQTMSYTLDIYFGKIKASTRLIDYLAYVAFFPQLVAGPIERARQLLPQFHNVRVFEYRQATDGCRQILWGFLKKLVIADRLGPLVDLVYEDIGSSTGPMIAFATVAFAFQIYCDFSAYSDIAIGTARLFGFELMRNFAYPYFSQSVSEFWRRWHISLSTWFRDYVFIPLGGSRSGRRRLIRNLVLTFTISGLWHGASWNFIVWGMLMGVALVVELWLANWSKTSSTEIPAPESMIPRPAVLLRMLATFCVICVGWIFFRAPTLSTALNGLARIFNDALSPSSYEPLWSILADRTGRSAALGIVFILVVEWIQRRHPHPFVLPHMTRWQRWAVYTAALWVMVYLGPKGLGRQFIYFQF